MVKFCIDCLFYEHSLCRLRGPIADGDRAAFPRGKAIWPHVAENDWCDEFREKESTPETK